MVNKLIKYLDRSDVLICDFLGTVSFAGDVTIGGDLTVTGSVNVGVDELDREALVEILTEPKNALVKQYQYMLKLDDVELEFSTEALGAAADLTMKRETGARGLRSIIENTLLNVMFEIPGRDDIRKVMIDVDVINSEKQALIYSAEDKQIEWQNDGSLKPEAKSSDNAA